jgi:hypothetical protein
MIFCFFRGFFRFLSSFEFFWFFWVFFFQISGASVGEKRNPHLNLVLHRSGSNLSHEYKNIPEPTPVECKTRELPETQTRHPY